MLALRPGKNRLLEHGLESHSGPHQTSRPAVYVSLSSRITNHAYVGLNPLVGCTAVLLGNCFAVACQHDVVASLDLGP